MNKLEQDLATYQQRFHYLEAIHFELEQRLAEAEKVIEFYGSMENWSEEYLRQGSYVCHPKLVLSMDNGRLARKYRNKYKSDEIVGRNEN